MTILDIELIDHLDFDFIPPCEVRGCDPNPAEYKVIFACCAHTMLWCEECVETSKWYQNTGGLYYCEQCGATNIRKPFSLVEKL